MKNHELVDGKLLKINKKYSDLKVNQKERIYQWMYDAYRDTWLEKGTYPSTEEDYRIIEVVLERIENAGIWIPDEEIIKYYRSKKKDLHKRLAKENRDKNKPDILLEILEPAFSVCKLEDYSKVDLGQPFCFLGCTDEENSMVCPTERVPDNCTHRDDGWRCFRINDVLDFSLIGILARITKVLAHNEIGVFAISTYNTDYILTKSDQFDDAVTALLGAGYRLSKKGPSRTQVTVDVMESNGKNDGNQ